MPEATRERLGILGGTFDPIHVGHIVAAVDVRAALALDRMLLVVAGDPWQKRGQVVAAAADRFAMAGAAIEGVAGLEVSSIEVDRAGPTYTAETLARLVAPGRELFLVLGADTARRLPTWHDVDTVRELATIVVVERAGEHGDVLDGNWRVEHVAIPRLDVSSSDLRARLAAGRPIDGLVPPSVVHLIGERGLYTHGR